MFPVFLSDAIVFHMSKQPGRPAKIDNRKLAQLYGQGVDPQEIAAEFGAKPATIRQRISTLGLRPLRERVRESTLDEASKIIRNALSEDVGATVDGLGRHDPTQIGLDDLEKRERVAASVTKRAATTYGWDTESSSPSVIRIGIMSQVVVESRRILANESPIHNTSLSINGLEIQCDQSVTDDMEFVDPETGIRFPTGEAPGSSGDATHPHPTTPADSQGS